MAEMRAELVGLLIEKHGERAKIKLDKDKICLSKIFISETEIKGGKQR